jgi:catechol 2,3-dioxygenase-like lactoylglutathione lyase family enzyme
VRVERVSFLAVRTPRRDEVVSFFSSALGMTTFLETASMVALRLGGGDVVEVFQGDDASHSYFGCAPVVGFEVDDLEAAHAELTATASSSEIAGVEILGGIHHGSMGSSWFHFRGPDGNVYELLRSAPLEG